MTEELRDDDIRGTGKPQNLGVELKDRRTACTDEVEQHGMQRSRGSDSRRTQATV
jgi:hypothetical protein